jgi:hypothetical protein
MDQDIGHGSPTYRPPCGREKNQNHPPPKLAFEFDSLWELSLDIRPPSSLGAFGSAPTTPLASPSPHRTTFNSACTPSLNDHGHGASTSPSRPPDDVSESTTSALGTGRSCRHQRSESDILGRALSPRAFTLVLEKTSVWPVPPECARFAAVPEIVDVWVAQRDSLEDDMNEIKRECGGRQTSEFSIFSRCSLQASPLPIEA